MKYQLLIVLLLGIALGNAGAGAGAANISGTWTCSIEMGEPKPFNVTFAFKQDGETLSGAYTNPKGGEYPVTGTVKGDKVVFSYVLSAGKQEMTVRYTGTIASPAKMTGTVEWIGGGVPPGKWTATKKK
jgi:hypothetical protein